MEIILKCFNSCGRILWKKSVNFLILANRWVPSNRFSQRTRRIFYAGGVSGNRGGPRVKVALLKKEFPQSFLRFNIVYSLSNFPFLDQPSIELLKRLHIPLVLNQNGVYSPGWFGDGWMIRNEPNATIYRNSDYVFWQSHFAREASRKYLSSHDPKGEILYNAVNLSLYSPRRGIKKELEFTFLVAGNFTSSSYYQVEGAITALSLINRRENVRLKIVGLTRALEREALRLATNLGVSNRIILIGKYSQAMAPELIKSSDAYIALKYMDTCPNLVIEALACGLPVIFSDTGGTKELVDKSCGIGVFVAEDWNTKPIAPDPICIAQAMERLVLEHREMSIAARARAEEKFDIRQWYLRHEIVFNELITERGKYG